MEQTKVTLELSLDEGLVFYEPLHRFNATEVRHFDDQSEERVLWDLEAMLESVLVEPVNPRCEELLAKARAAVRDSEE